jgi:uncharacterized protein (DUF952 family)
MTRATFHLVPREVWDAADPGAPYAADSLASEGFIHCTDGRAALLATADRHFAGDPRAYVVLTVDLARVASPWRIDDAAGIYPHVYGPIDRSAIIGRAAMERDTAGRFTGIGPELDT